MNRITDEEIEYLIKKRELTVERVINSVIDINALIGVGLITLAQNIYLYTILNPHLRTEGITQKEIIQVIEDYKQKHYSNPLN